MPTCSYLDSPGPLAFAHRGGAGDGVENALSSFEQVARLGFRYIETDVRTTADGVAVVFHDADLGRLTGRAERVDALTFREVQSLTLTGGERIAALEQVLGAFPDLRFNLDCKDAGSTRSVPAAIARTAAKDRVCVTSFSQRRVRQVRRALGPDVCTGLGVGGVALFLLRTSTGMSRGHAAGVAGVLQVPWFLPGRRTLPARVVRRAQREGLAVHVWTLDDPRSINAALDLGVDGIMTDHPVVLKEELVRRGLWHT